VIENRPLPGGAYLLRLACADARREEPRSRPGQFVQLLARPSAHLLRRPMSIHDEGDGWRSFMIKPVGPASCELVALGPGANVDAGPPLGRGFPDAAELGAGPLLLVAGGFGIAPLHFLARRLEALPAPPEYALLYGGRTRCDVELDAVVATRSPVLVSTDDGSLGFRGTCVQLAAEWLERRGAPTAAATVLTCGPHAMMAALHAAVGARVRRLYASLESVMACGVGACMGCVTPSVHGLVPVCTQGPVFRGDEVFGVEMGTSHV